MTGPGFTARRVFIGRYDIRPSVTIRRCRIPAERINLVFGAGQPWAYRALYYIAIWVSLKIRLITCPTEGDGRLCSRPCWTTYWRQFKSDCHQTLSVIPLATGDEMIKFWKVKVTVKVGGEVCTLVNALLVPSWILSQSLNVADFSASSPRHLTRQTAVNFVTPSHVDDNTWPCCRASRGSSATAETCHRVL